MSDKDNRLHEAAVELGHEGGLVGGPKRASKLTAEERSDIARAAAKARWERAKAKTKTAKPKKKRKPKAVSSG